LLHRGKFTAQILSSFSTSCTRWRQVRRWSLRHCVGLRLRSRIGAHVKAIMIPATVTREQILMFEITPSPLKLWLVSCDELARLRANSIEAVESPVNDSFF